jgi:predicted transcriptional regulator
MPSDSTSSPVLQYAAQIVSAHVSNNSVQSSDLPCNYSPLCD